MSDTEKRIYYDILGRAWKIFSMKTSDLEFSDEWWQIIISRLDEILVEYRNTEYAKFAWSIIDGFIEEHKRRQERWKRDLV